MSAEDKGKQKVVGHSVEDANDAFEGASPVPRDLSNPEVNRIWTSAAQLGRSLFDASNGASLTTDLASLHASAGKGGPSSSRTSHTGVDSVDVIGHPGTSARARPDGSFRSIGAFTTASNTEEQLTTFQKRISNPSPGAFFLDDGPYDQDITATTNPLAHDSTHPWINEYTPSTNPSLTYLSHPEDGAAVVDLLSSPYSTLSTTPSTPIDDDLPTTAELFTADIPAAALPTLEGLKTRLPSPPTHNPPSLDNPLRIGTASGSSHADALQDSAYMLPGAWDDFDEHYTDDVWGGPSVAEYVGEALKWVQAQGRKMLEGEGKQSGPVRRLGMLWGHLGLGGARQ
ncbi:MAG: hypothetical protein M1833_001698 [Piccolia ochrophora]|nr:MAG: hypothetical protein M1833_001698 [Piccolia ochrophora]